MSLTKQTFPYSGSRASVLFPGLAIVLIAAFLSSAAFTGETIDQCQPAELEQYLALAYASEKAYDDAQPDLETTPSGAAALIYEDAGGNLVIAFRGSMLADRKPKHRFSSFGGANICRNYRDWVATNFKQTTGFCQGNMWKAPLLPKSAFAPIQRISWSISPDIPREGEWLRMRMWQPVFVSQQSRRGNCAASLSMLL